MSEQNLNCVRGLYAAQVDRDEAAMRSLLSDDVRWHTVGRPEDFPVFGPRHGPDQVVDFFSTVAGVGDFSHFETESFHVSGDKVFALGRNLLTIRATGKTMDSAFAHVFTLKDGKCVAFQEFLDTAQLADAYRP